MLGFHYTAERNLCDIYCNGLWPKRLNDNHSYFRSLSPERGAIWVFRYELTGKQLAGILVDIAKRHDTGRIICLKVEYPPEDSLHDIVLTREQLQDPEAEGVVFNHTMNFGYFSHNAKIDLIIKPIQFDQIELVGLWDFEELITNRLNELTPIGA